MRRWYPIEYWNMIWYNTLLGVIHPLITVVSNDGDDSLSVAESYNTMSEVVVIGFNEEVTKRRAMERIRPPEDGTRMH